MQLSARNNLSGTVTNVELGTVMAKVELDINGQKLTSLVSKDAVEELGIKVGENINALIKSTSVMLMK